MEEKVKKPRKSKSSGVNEASAVIEQAALESKEEQAPAVPLTPQEQAQMLRDYVASMEKTVGHDNESVSNIIESIHKRLILAINYSGLGKLPEVKGLKTELQKIIDDETKRYADE